jgi:hypothetical protein
MNPMANDQLCTAIFVPALILERDSEWQEGHEDSSDSSETATKLAICIRSDEDPSTFRVLRSYESS